MEKLHFTSKNSAENFDLHNIADPLSEPLRSKSQEHNKRFINIENSQKSTKNEDLER